VRWRQAAVPFVVALADRAGADLYAFRHGPEDAPDVRQEVRGDEFPIRKVKPGGWSQRRYQERAENTWEENAEDVAGAIVRLAGRVDARLVVLAGDERARGLIAHAWPAGFDTPVEVVHGERPWDGSGPNVPDDVQAVVDRFVELETSALVERFAEERGQGDLAADGAGPTLGALSASQAAVVLLRDDFGDDVGDDPRAWSGPAPVPVAANRDDLAALGVENPREVRTIDAAIRAAIATDAGVRLVPREVGPADGVGALLRWSGTA